MSGPHAVGATGFASAPGLAGGEVAAARAALPEELQAALEGRYVVSRELGRGGMATVYLAHDPRHEREVAVKVLAPELARSLGAERFLREIKLVGRLQHPHILPLFDSGAAQGVLWFVSPYVRGDTLRARIAQVGALPVDEALRIASAVAGALDYAHRQGVVHRDVKPENVLLQDGHPIVADFGVARAISTSADATLTHTGVAVGTPAYMSPEQAAGEREVDERSDVYSLGCVLYEMLAGRPPFTGPTAQAVMTRRFTETPPPLRSLRAGIPEGVEQAVARAIAREPDRFQRAAELADALQSALASLAAPAASDAVAAASDAPRSGNPEAQRLFEQARRTWARRASDALPQAAMDLEAALARDPAFAAAHAALAAVQLARADVDLGAAEAAELAARSAATALALDPALGEAQAALGMAHTLAWRWDDAERAFARAAELAPGSPTVHHWHAVHLAARGRADAACAAVARATALAPESAVLAAAAGALLCGTRRWDDAAAACGRAARLDPRAPFPHVVLGLVHAARGEHAAAVDAQARAVDLFGVLHPLPLAALGCVCASAGRRTEAAEALSDLESLARRAAVSPFLVAAVHAALGDPDAAFAALDRAVEARDPWLLALRTHPWLDPLRTDPRLAELVGRMGM
jgi:tetratricopeptide (TPR) repeat protein